MYTTKWTYRLYWSLALSLVMILALGAMLLQPLTARAATITVTSALDSGAGTLRQAIADASPGDTIVFNNSMSIYLNSELNIAKNLTIDGGAHTIIISGDSGNDGSRNVRAFNISAGSVVTLTHLTIANCYHSDRGAGIYNAGSLTVSGCNISNNTASYGGGAINNNNGTLNIRDSVLSNNAVNGFGGAILVYRGNVLLQNSTLSGNSAPNGGGAVDYYQIPGVSGSLTVLTSTFAHNSSWYGGAIHARYASLVVQHSVFAYNTAQYTGGGIYFDTENYPLPITVDNSTFVGNIGGTIWDAYVRGGGGIYNYQGEMTIRNSTFSGNAAPQSQGGAIVSWQSLTLLNSTLSGNSSRNEINASGLANWGSLHIKNTLIAGGSPGPDCIDMGTIVTNVNNLVEDGSCSENGVNFQTGDPRVESLADNGGPRIGAVQDTPLLTHALLPGSPAIDAGDPTTCLTADQRGVARPQGAACDIGAVEATSRIRMSKTVTPPSVAPGQAITFTLTLSNTGGLPATGIVVTDTLPAILSDLSFASTLTVTDTGHTPYAWTVQDLAPGQGGVITITGALTAPLAAGVYTNTAVIAAEGDLPAENNTAVVTFRVADTIFLPLVLKNTP